MAGYAYNVNHSCSSTHGSRWTNRNARVKEGPKSKRGSHPGISRIFEPNGIKRSFCFGIPWKPNSSRLWMNSSEVAICSNDMQQQRKCAGISPGIQLLICCIFIRHRRIHANLLKRRFQSPQRKINQSYEAAIRCTLKSTTLAVFSITPTGPSRARFLHNDMS